MNEARDNIHHLENRVAELLGQVEAGVRHLGSYIAIEPGDNRHEKFLELVVYRLQNIANLLPRGEAINT